MKIQPAACKVLIYFQYLALSIYDSSAEIRLVCCWLHFDFNPLLIIQTIIKGIHRVNQYALQRPVPILHNMQGIDRVNQCMLQRPLSIFGSNSKIRSSRRFVSLAAV